MKVMRVGAPRNVSGLVGALALGLILAAPARAADRVAAPATAAPDDHAAKAKAPDEKEARRLFQRAELSFNLGKFGEALTDYQSAYEAKPLPGFLFNIAQCYRNLGDSERARFFFRRYLALDPRTPNRRRVEELIDEMTKQLDARQAEHAAAPASSSGGEPKPVEPAPAVPPALPAAPVAAASSPESTPGVVATPLVTAAAPSEAPSPVWKRWWFWTGLGAVVVGGVVATLLLTRGDTRAPGSLPPIDGRGP
jgi:tetratricopeptide (TPR) repeat protein